jgi:electron transport complex protein RnfC
MASRIGVDDLDGATGFGLSDCIGCGCCAYVCPSHIPLVQYFSYAKGELSARERSKLRNDATRRLAEERLARLEREARDKAAAAANARPSATPPRPPPEPACGRRRSASSNPSEAAT